jgi:hypothetical protein
MQLLHHHDAIMSTAVQCCCCALLLLCRFRVWLQLWNFMSSNTTCCDEQSCSPCATAVYFRQQTALHLLWSMAVQLRVRQVCSVTRMTKEKEKNTISCGSRQGETARMPLMATDSTLPKQKYAPHVLYSQLTMKYETLDSSCQSGSSMAVFPLPAYVMYPLHWTTAVSAGASF